MSRSAGVLYRAAVAACLLALACGAARADWHYGKVINIYFAYDGSNVTLLIEGLAKTGCTCYSSWPERQCLDRTHVSFKEQLAAIYLAKASGATLAINIDETTCKVIALGVQ